MNGIDSSLSRRSVIISGMLVAAAAGLAPSPALAELDKDGQSSPATIKFIFIGKKKKGMSTEDFRKYYEGHHSLLINKMSGVPIERYVRRYLNPMAGYNVSQTDAFNYDVITEIWSANRADFDLLIKRFSEPDMDRMFSTDELNLFDRDSMLYYLVEEHERDMSSTSRPRKS